LKKREKVRPWGKKRQKKSQNTHGGKEKGSLHSKKDHKTLMGREKDVTAPEGKEGGGLLYSSEQEFLVRGRKKTPGLKRKIKKDLGGV